LSKFDEQERRKDLIDEYEDDYVSEKSEQKAKKDETKKDEVKKQEAKKQLEKKD
jgi:hypothetical protein